MRLRIVLPVFFALLCGWAAACAGGGASGLAAAPAAEPNVSVETPHLRFSLSPATGAWEIADKTGGVTWRSGPFRPRFGQAMLKVEGKPTGLSLERCEARAAGGGVEATFRPVASGGGPWVRVRILPAADGRALDFSYEASDPAAVESIRILDEAFWTTDAEKGAVLVPVREGLFIPADSGKAFSQSFDTYAYEGCHMQMVGVLKGGAAALVTWDDCYAVAEVKSTVGATGAPARQVLGLSMVLRKSARGVRVQFPGKGDAAAVAKAYRGAAASRGLAVTWDEKLRGHPERARYFGAANYKLWSTLSRRMSEDSAKEVSVRVNWTFDEAAQVAEHLKRDLRLDRVLFMMGGWIHRGYDNQHPDVLPTAPECGGDAAFADACRRIRALGYILSLHDNYQDIYRDSPSWSEDYVMKRPDGSLVRGGLWAGGRAYLTCSPKALELARRPQNLAAVKKLSGADSYFIDTTYAAGLQECFDPKHPLSRAEDMRAKQALSDYAREVFGSFGSECGREWAVPHADFFEGLTGVSGTYYHNKGLLDGMGAVPLPLFEMVYRDCIAMWGKYGYDINRSAEYVLWHALIGRPLNYHSVPPHLYWKEVPPAAGGRSAVAVMPLAAEAAPAGPRQMRITYHWQVEEPPAGDWDVFVHFTDPSGKNIRFQNDHAPRTPVSAWPKGEVVDGPFTVTAPEGAAGAFDVRVGFYKREGLRRATLQGQDDGEQRYVVGRIKVAGDAVEFTPAAPKAAPRGGGDPALFARSDGGWAEGMHPYDVFVKNTYEVLSPLNEITSRVRMTGHEFLSADRAVRRSRFGEGAEAVEVTVNLGDAAYACRSKAGGDVVLGAYGFLVDGPTLAAFSALKFGGLDYAAPPLFVLRSLDGKPLAESARVRIYHGFGDPRVRLAGREYKVEREAVMP